jgi:hypothetical protein
MLLVITIVSTGLKAQNATEIVKRADDKMRGGKIRF